MQTEQPLPTALLLNGRALAASLKSTLLQRSTLLHAAGTVPRLGVVLVGEDKASHAYTDSLQRVGADCAVAVDRILLPLDVTAAELSLRLAALCAGELVHGVLLGQPLPGGLVLADVVESIAPSHDVDGANPVSRALARFGRGFAPATPLAVMRLIEQSPVADLAGVDALVIGASSVVGAPLASMLTARGATVTIAHKLTKDLPAKIAAAELVISATGVPGLVQAHMLRTDAVVIDVGTSVIDGKLVGDVIFAEAVHRVRAITPVPGGVGPVTNVVLMENVIIAAERASQL